MWQRYRDGHRCCNRSNTISTNMTSSNVYNLSPNDLFQNEFNHVPISLSSNSLPKPLHCFLLLKKKKNSLPDLHPLPHLTVVFLLVSHCQPSCRSHGRLQASGPLHILFLCLQEFTWLTMIYFSESDFKYHFLKDVSLTHCLDQPSSPPFH